MVGLSQINTLGSRSHSCGPLPGWPPLLWVLHSQREAEGKQVRRKETTSLSQSSQGLEGPNAAYYQSWVFPTPAGLQPAACPPARNVFSQLIYTHPPTGGGGMRLGFSLLSEDESLFSKFFFLQSLSGLNLRGLKECRMAFFFKLAALRMNESVNLEFDSWVNWTNGLSRLRLERRSRQGCSYSHVFRNNTPNGMFTRRNQGIPTTHRLLANK